jgi:predicted  nucleic acid-binding Zn-ribbon protein
MKQILNNLVRLQNLESGLGETKGESGSVEELRSTIPPQVLQHCDRLRERGKKAVASVRHGVCGQCHMQVAVGLLAQLRRGDNLYRCENCGAYLNLIDEQPVLEMPPRINKPGRRGRPRKVRAHAA